MNIRLRPDQQEWLEAQVAKGEFASVDDAVQQMIAERMLFPDNLSWAKPYVDKARASVARGDVLTGEEYFRRLNDKLASLRSS